MPYCDLDDSQALIPLSLWNHDGSSPEPSLADATEWITEADAEIDSKLSARYTVPITDAGALNVVKQISAALVAERIWGVVFTGQTGAPDVPQHIKDMRKLLDGLAAGAFPLDGATPIGSGAGPGSPESTFPPLERTDEDELSTETPPIFTMSDRF